MDACYGCKCVCLVAYLFVLLFVRLFGCACLLVCSIACWLVSLWCLYTSIMLIIYVRVIHEPVHPCGSTCACVCTQSCACSMDVDLTCACSIY